jgi:hypothetical protein
VTDLLTWRHATRADRSALQSFQCTEPSRKTRIGHRWQQSHPAEWELFVQSHLRAARPPLAEPLRMFVGHDEQGLAAVIIGEDRAGPALVEANFGAVAMRVRHKGGAYADEMMGVFIADAMGRAASVGLPRFSVTGMVHERNLPSRHMLTRAGFGFVRTAKNQPDYQIWMTLIHVTA